MALTHSTALRDAFADAVRAAVNANGPPGSFILKVGATEAATCVLNDPAFAAAAGGSIELLVVPEPTDNDATGNASPIDAWDYVDGAATVIFSGDETDITLTKATIATDDIVKLTQFTYIATP